MKYRVVTGIDFATKEAAIKRILAVEHVEWKDRGMKRLEVGEIVDVAAFGALPENVRKVAIAKGWLEEEED